MVRTIALTTALACVATLHSAPAAAQPAVVLSEQHFNQDGVAVDLYITDAPEGILAEATLTDLATGEVVDFWSDGEMIQWSGPGFEGSVPARELTGEDPPPQPLCYTPLTAIICIGVVLLSAATCAHQKGCIREETEVPGGAGGVPPGDDGAGGDGDGDGDSGKSGGGDED